MPVIEHMCGVLMLFALFWVAPFFLQTSKKVITRYFIAISYLVLGFLSALGLI